ncbi:MAG: glycoside hydrolase family 43 protein [Prevotella sp.]|jgi:beta-xylosidase|nr:glycoside hydrolase family 43 protein [Prevotella sp.]
MKKILFTFLAITLVFTTSCKKEQPEKPLVIVNPVLAGDRPDPTIIKIGDTYWASATSNEWSPLFPIFKSTDMVNWELVSYVFPDGAPDWALNNFWAPELHYDAKQKKVYIYYTARVKATNQLCVAVASADTPDGKYTDHGVLVNQEAGSIDAFEVTDENGKIYLTWKEDGNSMGRATPIWAQEINPERTKLLGEPVELFRNDESNDSSWERWLIEGVCIFKKGDFYYATYSGGSCCDKGCNYKTGVARSKNVLGPWEKYDKNPILTDNADWKCSGHGTVVPYGDDLYMLYHAYNTTGDVYVGRQGVLEKIEWTEDNWPVFKNNAKYDRKAESLDFIDTFEADKLNPVWQWRVTQKIDYQTGKDGLKLKSSTENQQIGTLLVQQTKSLDYSLVAEIDILNSGKDAASGIALVGGADNGFGAPLAAVGITVKDGKVEVWRNAASNIEKLGEETIDAASMFIKLEMKVSKGYLLTFSVIEGEDGVSKEIVKDYDASPYVPWGMGFRFGLVSKGDGGNSVFKNIRLSNN